MKINFTSSLLNLNLFSQQKSNIYNSAILKIIIVTATIFALLASVKKIISFFKFSINKDVSELGMASEKTSFAFKTVYSQQDEENSQLIRQEKPEILEEIDFSLKAVKLINDVDDLTHEIIIEQPDEITSSLSTYFDSHDHLSSPHSLFFNEKHLTSLVEDTDLFHSDSTYTDSPISTSSDLSPLSLEEEKEHLGKQLVYLFEDKQKNVYGTETVERIDVIENLKSGLEQQVSILKSDLSFLKASSLKNLEKRQAIESAIQLCEQSLDGIYQLRQNFIHSNFYRDELKKAASDIENYKDLVNAICIGAPVNFRYQQIKTSHHQIGFFRLGVISDFRIGLTHLAELKELAQNRAKLDQKLHFLKKKWDQYQTQKKQAKAEAYKYAYQALQPENIQSTLIQRQHGLQLQMLQLIQGQAEKNLENIQNQSVFYLTHLSLLNPQTNKIDSKTGWVHNETYEMLDMYEILQEFEGKTLVFDGLGPCMDSEGRVHLTQSLVDENGQPKTIKLSPCFLNICVQGYTKNDGLQKKINDQEFNRLMELSYQKLKEDPSSEEKQQGLNLLLKVKQQLDQGSSNFEIAEDLSVALLKLNIPLSLSCLSAKDRTGFVAARTVYRFVSEDMAFHPIFQNQPKKLNKLREQFARQLLDPNGCAALVVKDNTEVTILKCSPFHLPGYSDGIQGKFKRVGYYLKQAQTIFQKPKSPKSSKLEKLKNNEEQKIE